MKSPTFASLSWVALSEISKVGHSLRLCGSYGGELGRTISYRFMSVWCLVRSSMGTVVPCSCSRYALAVVNGEQKTKPTQQAIRDVKSAGLSPDLVGIMLRTVSYNATNSPKIACRCAEPLVKETTDKISRFCDLDPEQVIAVHDVASTYHGISVPTMLPFPRLTLQSPYSWRDRAL